MREDELLMAITICNADKIDTSGCHVVVKFGSGGKRFKKSFKCRQDVKVAIKAAVEYEKKIRSKYAKPVVPKPKKIPPTVNRVGAPRLDSSFGELFAVCPYIARNGRSRLSKIPVGSVGIACALEQAESMARKMSMFGRKLKK